MIMVYVGYGLFILYCFMVLLMSIMLWGMLGLGFLIYRNEDHKVDADWRPLAVVLMLVSLALQWALLKCADHMIPTMWHSIPSLPAIG